MKDEQLFVSEGEAQNYKAQEQQYMHCMDYANM